MKTQVDKRSVVEMQGSGPYLHLFSFTNILVIVGWRRQPHVAEGQLSLWLPAMVRQHRDRHMSAYQQSHRTQLNTST